MLFLCYQVLSPSYHLKLKKKDNIETKLQNIIIDKRYLYIVYRKRNIYLKQNKRKKQKQNQFKKTDKTIKQKKL